MKIAVFSDIHGNHIAFERCLEYAFGQNIHTFFFLGDYVGELAYPEKTMHLLWEMQKKYDCHFVRGNKENYWIAHRAGKTSGWAYGDSTTGSLLYCYERLGEEDLDFMESLPIVRQVVMEGMPPILLCHGSPFKVNEKMLPGDEKTLKIMEQIKDSVILCGHTHVQRKIEHDDKRVLNPGSVGVALGSGGKTQFMILHGAEGIWTEEFVSLAYDVESAIRELHESGLDEAAPCWCQVTEQLLRTGEIAHGTVLARAMELCREETGNCVWPEIPEKYWQLAVKKNLLKNIDKQMKLS